MPNTGFFEVQGLATIRCNNGLREWKDEVRSRGIVKIEPLLSRLRINNGDASIYQWFREHNEKVLYECWRRSWIDT